MRRTLPQLIATARNRGLFPPEVLATAISPEAIADVIAFLVSDRAGPVNAAIVPVYGT